MCVCTGQSLLKVLTLVLIGRMRTPGQPLPTHSPSTHLVHIACVCVGASCVLCVSVVWDVFGVSCVLRWRCVAYVEVYSH